MEKEKFIIKTVLMSLFVLVFGFIYINFVKEDEFLVGDKIQINEIESSIETYEFIKNDIKVSTTSNLLLKPEEADENKFIETFAFYDNEKNITNEKENIKKSNKININTATADELCELPSIGEATADLIIEYREIYGKFKDIKQIKNVKRIGEKTYQKIKDLICID